MDPEHHVERIRFTTDATNGIFLRQLPLQLFPGKQGIHALETNGGQPGGNIRTAYLYNPERVSLIDGSVQTITDPADQQSNPNSTFFASRLPLVESFRFNGQDITLINNHFSSKGGSRPLFGVTQSTTDLQESPDVNGSLDQRRNQATPVKSFVDNIMARNPQANVIVLGDFNEFEFISPLLTLGESLNDLVLGLPENERYSFNFEGNSQSLDHLLVRDNLLQRPEFDIVHVNTEFASTPQTASDHDPLFASFNLAGNADPIDSIQDLRGDVLQLFRDSDLNLVQKLRLTVRLEIAVVALRNNRPQATISQLRQFTNIVNSFVQRRRRVLSKQQGEALTRSAQEVISLIQNG